MKKVTFVHFNFIIDSIVVVKDLGEMATVKESKTCKRPWRFQVHSPLGDNNRNHPENEKFAVTNQW